MSLLGFASAMDLVAWRGLVYTVFILNFVFACQLLLLQPLVSALDGKPGDTADLFERVSQSIKVKRYSEALDDLNTAIEADPTLSEAYWHRASILRQMCRYKDAEKNYKKFLEKKPGNSAAEKELSQLYQAQSALDTASNLFDSGDFTKSLDFVDKVVLVFSPACSKAKLLKVKLLLAAKDYSSAISETGYILKEDENNLDALLIRGRAYYYLADHDVALRHYQKGLRLDPEHSELKKAYFGLKNLLKKTKSAEDNESKGKLRLAVEDFKAAIALDPNHLAYNVHLHLGLCKVLVKLGRGKEALSSCNEALNIDEELVEALVQRGEAKLLIEDWEGAVADLKSAAEKSPQDTNIRETFMRARNSDHRIYVTGGRKIPKQTSFQPLNLQQNLDTLLMDSPETKEHLQNVFLRRAFTLLFSLFAVLSVTFLVGFMVFLIGISSIPNPISIHSQCKIVTSSVDLRSSKVCELGLLNYKAKHVFYPFERKKFRCRYDYYWASVFKVEYKDHAGQTQLELAEAPNEVLPQDCRPNFGAAWLTKDRFKVNETYDCWYTFGISKVNIYDGSFFNCQANDPSTIEMLRRYSILSEKILWSWITSMGRPRYLRLEVVAGVVTGFLTSLITISLFGLLLQMKSSLPRIRAVRILPLAARLKRVCFFVAYFSFAGWLAIQYGKRLGLPEIFRVH